MIKKGLLCISKIVKFPSQNRREINWIAERCSNLMNTITLDNSLTESERCATVLILQDFCGNYLVEHLFPYKDYEKYKDEDDK
jgi:hypothetical protein